MNKFYKKTEKCWKETTLKITLFSLNKWLIACVLVLIFLQLYDTILNFCFLFTLDLVWYVRCRLWLLGVAPVACRRYPFISTQTPHFWLWSESSSLIGPFLRKFPR
jgi:hypothetical protein